MTEQKGITYDQVASAAQNILDNGGTLTVRAVINVTGGKTETVSQFLRDFKDKLDADVSSMANELGSSKIAVLLASEIQSVLSRKTAELKAINERVKKDRDEVIDLLDEKEKDCLHRVEIAEARAINAEKQIKQAEQQVKDTLTENKAVNQDALEKVKKAQENADIAIKNAEQKSESLITVANERLEKSENETALLREQVKTLTVDNAKFELERERFEQANKNNEKLSKELALTKELNVKYETQIEANVTDIKRLNKDLTENKVNISALQENETLLLVSERKNSELNNKVSQLEKERDILSSNAIKNASQKSESLITVANERLEKSENETALLREQVKTLTVDNVKALAVKEDRKGKS
jgi:antitoxin component YwqK of YwqJK toxin-antitoxin module